MANQTDVSKLGLSKPYIILRKSDPESLATMVIRHIDIGYKPLGGVQYVPAGENNCDEWIQAVVYKPE